MGTFSTIRFVYYVSFAVPPDPEIGFELPSLIVLETDGNISVCVELLDLIANTVTASLQVIGGSATGEVQNILRCIMATIISILRIV